MYSSFTAGTTQRDRILPPELSQTFVSAEEFGRVKDGSFATLAVDLPDTGSPGLALVGSAGDRVLVLDAGHRDWLWCRNITRVSQRREGWVQRDIVWEDSTSGRAVSRYYGALDAGPMRQWRLRQAKPNEQAAVRAYYQRWLDIGGQPPPYIVAFVNSRSGNQKVARAIKDQLGTLLGHVFRESTGGDTFVAGHVCELSEAFLNPGHIRNTIRDIRSKISTRALRFLVCGGDGTVTWVLQELEACRLECPQLFRDEPDPPIGIVPAGTGNDLSRSLGWGPKLRRVADLAIYVQWMLCADVVHLDQWKVKLKFPQKLESGTLPPAFKYNGVVEGDHQHEYVGFFQNYFSAGMDANVMYGVERARRGRIGKCFFGSGLGKVCFGMQAPRALCCFSRLLRGPERADGVLLDDHPQELGHSRMLALLNVNSYGAGRVVFSDEDFEKVRPADGRLELFSLRGPVAFGRMMVLGGAARLIEQAQRVKLTFDSPEYFQMDGESWYAPAACTVEVERNRQVQMLRPPTCPPGIWTGRQSPGFWHFATTSGSSDRMDRMASVDRTATASQTERMASVMSRANTTNSA